MQTIQKRLWRDELYVLAVAAILTLLLFFWYSPGHAEKLDMTYLWPMAAAVMAVAFLRQGARPHRCALGSLALLGWFWLCCVLNGDPYLLYNSRFLLGIALTFGVAYPLFLLVDGALCPARLKALAALYVLLMLMIALPALYAGVTGKELSTPLSDQTLGIRGWRLFVFAYHPNEVASAFSIGLMLALWLCFAYKRVIARALCALSALAIFFALSLTASYTVMITVTFALGLSTLIVALRLLRVRSKAIKTVVCCLAALCVAAAVFFSFTPALNLIKQAENLIKPQPTQQSGGQAAEEQPTAIDTSKEVQAVDIVGDLASASSRFSIWKSGLSYLRERPATLLIGSLDSVVARVPMRYGDEAVYHMHDIWLETLLLVGVPGLLLYIWLCLMTLRGCLALALARGVPLEQRLLAVLPPMLMLNGIMEIYPGLSGNVMDVMYAVLCGAVIRLGDAALGQRTWRSLLRHSA